MRLMNRLLPKHPVSGWFADLVSSVQNRNIPMPIDSTSTGALGKRTIQQLASFEKCAFNEKGGEENELRKARVNRDG